MQTANDNNYRKTDSNKNTDNTENECFNTYPDKTFFLKVKL